MKIKFSNPTGNIDRGHCFDINNRLFAYKWCNGYLFVITAFFIFFTSCQEQKSSADAYGNFEVDATVISSQAAGELVVFKLEEGDLLKKGKVIGYVDSTVLVLQKQELMANKQVIKTGYINLQAEAKVVSAEMKTLVREKKRVEDLLKSDAATTKQLDDINGKIAVVKAKVQVIKSKYPSIKAQLVAIEVKESLLEERLKKCTIINPVEGTVLTKLVSTHELVNIGKPLYRIADLQNIILKAYVSGAQLSEISLNKEVKVMVDAKGGEMKDYIGKVNWIASNSEFTPKIIQTKEERVNLVYAIKVIVPNDGSLKIGMPAEVKFTIQ